MKRGWKQSVLEVFPDAYCRTYGYGGFCIDHWGRDIGLGVNALMAWRDAWKKIEQEKTKP